MKTNRRKESPGSRSIVFCATACLLALDFIPATCLFAQQTAQQTAENSSSEMIQPVGKIELVGSGFAFTEGPAWDPETQSLWFTDIPNASIHALRPDGSIRLVTNDSRHTNGLLMPIDGRVLGCQMDSAVVEYEATSHGTKSVEATTLETKILASQFDGKRFNAPNDLIVAPEGGIYFTDPLFRAPKPLPQEIQAVYYLSQEGAVSRVTDDIAAPNGIGISIDGKHLYVCPSQQAEMLVYDIESPHTEGSAKLTNKRVFCVVKQPPGKTATGADGITLDIKGNVYITTHLGVQIFSPTGKMLGLIEFPQQPSNVCFGGNDWKTLYATARTSVYAVEMPIPGFIPGDFK